MRILGVSGSLRADSHNTLLLREAAELFDLEVEFELFDGLRDVPPYDEDDDVDGGPAGAARFRAALAEADGVLVATPEYNSSIPGQLKNALDWASRPLATNPLRNVPVAVVGASNGAFGGVWSQAELRKVMGALGARVLDVELALPHAHDHFDERGSLVDAGYLAQLHEVVNEIYAAVERRAEITDRVAV